MNKFIMFILVLFITMGLLANLVSAEPNYYDRKTVRPAWCPNMVTKSSSTGAGDFILTVAANPDRISGYVVNLSSYPINFVGVYFSTDAVSGYVTSATTIVAMGGYLAATNTTDDSDKFFFREGDVVYTGALYLAAEHNEITLNIAVVEILRQ